MHPNHSFSPNECVIDNCLLEILQFRPDRMNFTFKTFCSSCLQMLYLQKNNVIVSYVVCTSITLETGFKVMFFPSFFPELSHPHTIIQLVGWCESKMFRYFDPFFPPVRFFSPIYCILALYGTAWQVAMCRPYVR